MNDVPTTVCGFASAEIEALLTGFTDYLSRERGLASTTVENYVNQVHPFLTWYAAHRTSSLRALRIGDITEFLTWRAKTCSPGSIMVAATGVRALMRWMFLEGFVDQQLAPAIGPVRYHAHAGMPKGLAADQIAALMAADMSIRDRAVVLLLARLGLRSREVAILRLDDVDWRAGQLMITGKGNDRQRMPLPVEIGQAIADYLRQERRQDVMHREVFLTKEPACGPLGRRAVSEIVTRLAHRAGLQGRVGAHRLRHSAATAVLAGGGTLTEAGQLLRHRSPASTAIYAKVAEGVLAQLVRPWPLQSGRRL